MTDPPPSASAPRQALVSAAGAASPRSLRGFGREDRADRPHLARAAGAAVSVDVVNPSEQLRPARPVRDWLRGDDLPVSKPDPVNAHATRGDDERTQSRRRREDAGVAELVTL
jgi:hypothetical protein